MAAKPKVVPKDKEIADLVAAQIAAVKLNVKAIRDMVDPAVEVQLAAIEINWKAIKYIKNLAPEALLLAISKDKYAEKFLSMLSPKDKTWLLLLSPTIKNKEINR